MSALSLPLLPMDTVTFLFTDIEGSTNLWEEYPDAMRLALARHDTLLREALERRGGVVFKTMGDAFCAAFPTANMALDAALEAQMLLYAEPWDLPESLRVRMALHTGSAEERGGDYYGPPLNRVARLLSAGHGGQVLLSCVVQELVRDALPAGVSLVDLGLHRLRDLGRMEPVFQMLHPRLPAAFPPLRSLDNPDLLNNLPQLLTSFIGRETELAAIKALVQQGRMVTLTGTGGAGKSRLSLQVAADLLGTLPEDPFPDGAWLVELAPLSDPALVAQTAASVLGVREEPGKSLQQTLQETLRAKRLLLILDNCEHLLPACAALAEGLLRFCPDLRILASSREALNIPGEQIYRVPSLSLPSLQREQTVEALSQYDAVRLFIDRAKAVQPAFRVTSQNAPAVAQICFRLDGVPLAIELAAARVRTLSVGEVNARLDQRFRLLTGGARTALPRQQTLRALMDWSYDLLTETEKTLLLRLSVFAGGWNLSAAEAVCSGAGIEDWEVLDLLTALADKSLTALESPGIGTPESGTRYRLLETVRQYAAEKLAQTNEVSALRDKHLAWCAAFAEEAEPHLRGPDQELWFLRLEVDHDNLRGALAWCAEAVDGARVYLRLAKTLWWFWFVHGYWGEGRRRLDEAVARWEGQPETAIQARALTGLGVFIASEGEYAAARSCHERARAIFRLVGDRSGEAGSLNNLGVLVWQRGDHEAARGYYEQALEINRSTANTRGEAKNLGNLGSVARDSGVYDAAQAYLEQSLTMFRALADLRSEGNVLDTLGLVARDLGDFAAAQERHDESLVISRALGDLNQQAYAVGCLGLLSLERGNHPAARVLMKQSQAFYAATGDKNNIGESFACLARLARAENNLGEARTLLTQSLTLARELESPRLLAGAMEEFAAQAQVAGQPKRAARLLGGAAAMRVFYHVPGSVPDARQRDEVTVAVRTAIGEDAWAEAWTLGQGMTEEQTIEYALSGTLE